MAGVAQFSHPHLSLLTFFRLYRLVLPITPLWKADVRSATLRFLRPNIRRLTRMNMIQLPLVENNTTRLDKWRHVYSDLR